MTTFGLSFGLNDESQLHGTINGLSSSSVSNISTLSTSSSAASSSAAASIVAASTPSAASTTLVTTSSATSATANSPPTVPSSPTSFKPTSYESHSRLIAGYPRLPGFYSSTYSGEQNGTLYPTNSASFYPSLSTHYELDKSNGNSWTSLSSQTAYSPYDPHHSFYSPYSNCYGAIDSAARRKNATRETTNTLKAWLYEHRKNPYPTKGEKIMLAIITKMTLTQVSTWFANARRRLKKENKMTWEPKNKSTESRDESDKDSSKDIDDDLSDKANDNGNGLRNILKEDRSNAETSPVSLLKSHHLSNHAQVSPLIPPPSHQQAFGTGLSEGDNIDGHRPKIWSLAHTATSEAASTLAGRLYPEWSAAYAQFGSNNMSDNLLINPLSDPYHHHHHHHHHHAHAHHQTGQHVQSSPSTPFYPKANMMNNSNTWNEDQHGAHLSRNLVGNTSNGNFPCSPVPFLSSNLKIHI